MTENELLQAIYNDTQELKTQVRSDIQELKSGMQELREHVGQISGDMQELSEQVSAIDNKVTAINLTLENEIRVNIRRVAEGHLDLSRNLHDALKIDNEKELLAIRVSVLETEMRNVKDRLEGIA